MTADDVKPSILKALQVAGLTKNTAPRLLSDNGPCYISSELRSFLKTEGIKPVNGRPCHPQTQGKIERYHRTMKNEIKLENYYLPEQLENAIAKFVEYFNYQRYHESLNNLTPADVYRGKSEKILKERQRVKRETLKNRKRNYYQKKYKKESLLINR